MIKKIIISKKTLNLIKYSNIITFETYSKLDKKNMKKIIKKLFGHKVEKINSLIGSIYIFIEKKVIKSIL